MNITNRQLAAFVYVAQLASFTRASEKANMSLSGLSIMIRELEGQPGCRLFDRTTRSVKLTPAGERLLPYALASTEQLAAVIADLAKLEVEQQLTLRIGCTPTFAASFLPAIYQGFQEAHPNISLQLVDADHHDGLLSHHRARTAALRFRHRTGGHAFSYAEKNAASASISPFPSPHSAHHKLTITHHFPVDRGRAQCYTLTQQSLVPDSSRAGLNHD